MKKQMNKILEYQEHYDISIWKFLKELFRRYIIHIWLYTNKNKDYHSWNITFFNFTFIAFKIQFNWHTTIFFNCRLSFSLLKPNLQIGIDFQRNTA